MGALRKMLNLFQRLILNPKEQGPGRALLLFFFLFDIPPPGVRRQRRRNCSPRIVSSGSQISSGRKLKLLAVRDEVIVRSVFDQRAVAELDNSPLSQSFIRGIGRDNLGKGEAISVKHGFGLESLARIAADPPDRLAVQDQSAVWMRQSDIGNRRSDRIVGEINLGQVGKVVAKAQECRLGSKSAL